MYNGWDKY